VLAVLGVGLGLGILLTWLLRRSEPGGGEGERRSADLEDVERRQAELYGRLRGALDPDEREALELEAARHLRAIEVLRTAQTSAAAPVVAAATAGRRQEATASPVPSRPGTGRLLAGFAAGVAVTLLIGWLVVSAQRDARPRQGESPVGGPPADHPEGAELSAVDGERLEGLRLRVAADADDLSARKQYALALLGTGQFFGAFSESQEILRRIPTDADGLYVEGMVRLQMGQDETAVELLDRVLAQYPEHVLALTAKGVALHRAGNTLGARMLWQQALAAAGGRNPQVERLLTLLEERTSEQPVSEPTAQGTPSAVPVPATPAGRSYRLRVELAAGTTAPVGATLFVFLRGDSPGPPVAVRRITAPDFPLDLELTAADSMLGRPLPERGTLGVRLDADGNASTRGAADLATEAPAATASATTLRLGGR
jgi:cytochrome c-type biogenesis protein CcmH